MNNQKNIIATDTNISLIIQSEIQRLGNNADLNHIDVSGVTNMIYLLFYEPYFNGDISKWDVSNVVDMSYMFSGSSFRGDISKWNVSNVIKMDGIFSDAEFEQDISDWKFNPSLVKDDQLQKLIEKSHERKNKQQAGDLKSKLLTKFQNKSLYSL